MIVGAGVIVYAFASKKWKNQSTMTQSESFKQQHKNVIRLLDSVNASSTLSNIIFASKDTFDNPNKIIEKINQFNDDQPLTLVLMTNGGKSSSCLQIMTRLLQRSGKLTIVVKDQAYSAGTILCLCADELVMESHAILGPVDTQFMGLSMNSFFALPRKSLLDATHNEASDAFGYFKNMAITELTSTEKLIRKALSKTREKSFSNEQIDSIVERFLFSPIPHATPIEFDELVRLGFNIRSPTIEEKFHLILSK